jgi:hypothetical protein
MVVTALTPVFVLNGSYCLGLCVCMVVTALASVFVLNVSYYLGLCVCTQC